LIVEFKERAAASLGRDYEQLDSPTNPYASGISIDKTYKGVHVKTPFKAFFWNPLAMQTWHVSHPYSAMEQTLHTLIHEVTHTTAWNHNSSFTTELSYNYAKFADSGDMEPFREALLNIYSKHWKTFNAMRKIYGRSSTSNIAKSLEGAEDRVQRKETTGFSRVGADASRRSVGGEGPGQFFDREGAPDGPRPTGEGDEAAAIFATRIIEILNEESTSEK